MTDARSRCGVGRGPVPAFKGQVMVEVLLVLPVFMMLVFTIMEIGHLSYRTILLHHAAYEAARVGSLTCLGTFRAATSCITPREDSSRIAGVVQRILPNATVRASVTKNGNVDGQEGCASYDVRVLVRQPVPMIFPMTGLFLANGGYRNSRVVEGAVRMPVEKPLFK